MDANSLMEKMGLQNKKVLIVHHDDLGFLHAQDEAFRKLGFSTGSVMMTGTWAMAFSNIPGVDLGVHIALTSEWTVPRMRPLTDGKSLKDKDGFLWPTLEDAWANITVEDAAAEMLAQVNSAYKLGIDVTHIDTHMGTVLRPDLAEIYVKLGMEFKVPVYLPVSMAEHGIEEPVLSFFDEYLNKINMPKYKVVDAYDTPPEKRREWYLEKISSLKPGIYHMLHHASVPNPDAMILPDIEKRIADYESLSDPGVSQKIKECELITYREIRDIMRKENFFPVFEP